MVMVDGEVVLEMRPSQVLDEGWRGIIYKGGVKVFVKESIRLDALFKMLQDELEIWLRPDGH